jgi:hypothetical protein
VDFIILSHLLGPKEEIETGLTPTMSLCWPGDLNNPDMSIKCSKPESHLDHPRSLRRQDPRVDFMIVSHSLGLKEEIESNRDRLDPNNVAVLARGLKQSRHVN